ncbi:uncharacterized [Lates japonicus]
MKYCFHPDGSSNSLQAPSESFETQTVLSWKEIFFNMIIILNIFQLKHEVNLNIFSGFFQELSAASHSHLQQMVCAQLLPLLAFVLCPDLCVTPSENNIHLLTSTL